MALLVCSLISLILKSSGGQRVAGLVRGFLPSELGERILLSGNAGQEQVRNLQQKKQNLEMEISNVEMSRQVSC